MIGDRFLTGDAVYAAYLGIRWERSEVGVTHREHVDGDSRSRDAERFGPVVPGTFLYAFAEAVFEAFDVGQRLSVADAARAAGVSESPAYQAISELSALGMWPYRKARSRKAALEAVGG